MPDVPERIIIWGQVFFRSVDSSEQGLYYLAGQLPPAGGGRNPEAIEFKMLFNFNAHVHPGQRTLGIFPVTPAPPVPVCPPATPDMISQKVKSG